MPEFRRDRSVEPITVSRNPAFPVHAGKSFVVTGAAGGVGRALSELLIAEGARVVLADIDKAEVDQLATALGGDEAGVHAVELNLLDQDSIGAAVASCLSHLGRIDGLANVAGVVKMAPALSHTRELWDLQFGVNVFGTFELTKEIAQHMADGGHGGAIVNVASEAGKVGHPNMLAYNASKAAVINITRVLAVELAPHHINVNCVAPGGVDTPMLHDVADKFGEMADASSSDIFTYMANEQLGRHIAPVEVAVAISFLLGNRVQAIRGVTLNVDGGVTPY
ncbi:SDR family NAD(P)-dependent oxidoreductase [Streptomyces sp. NPDC005820]|uniref:SDR family NAD(P)-dependent oxidoreductase n=1 Tax=Streptomyces sp. NPDC005820 TaxID=3157069 RepID=UPI0033DB5229